MGAINHSFFNYWPNNFGKSCTAGYFGVRNFVAKCKPVAAFIILIAIRWGKWITIKKDRFPFSPPFPIPFSASRQRRVPPVAPPARCRRTPMTAGPRRWANSACFVRNVKPRAVHLAAREPPCPPASLLCDVPPSLYIFDDHFFTYIDGILVKNCFMNC